MTVAAALRASRGTIMAERLIQAAREAARRDLISEQDEKALLQELGAIT